MATLAANPLLSSRSEALLLPTGQWKIQLAFEEKLLEIPLDTTVVDRNCQEAGTGSPMCWVFRGSSFVDPISGALNSSVSVDRIRPDNEATELTLDLDRRDPDSPYVRIWVLEQQGSRYLGWGKFCDGAWSQCLKPFLTPVAGLNLTVVPDESRPPLSEAIVATRMRLEVRDAAGRQRTLLGAYYRGADGAATVAHHALRAQEGYSANYLPGVAGEHVLASPLPEAGCINTNHFDVQEISYPEGSELLVDAVLEGRTSCGPGGAVMEATYQVFRRE
jgi:hypothetical protein